MELTEQDDAAEVVGIVCGQADRYDVGVNLAEAGNPL
jgi:hypothetical protein